ncbi:ring-opening amidohydrolase [Pseudonocardia dioxanivorans CB1190]|uniref:Cyanuric acid amidohydrolase n=1 Tax=Pseudonocardia dioxanivorans (strain ATCC 55486 / DSM 44775 / JCM 13855 / CB1190) TaxID=675635 RepID=CAH_PSEUX|nr:ring-opening amidohydrolase [Pseudonocardia dioxanivorans]F4CUJ4.1 RecName: Full=Cyanuric acid amidohydrolase; Short=CAH [Pseudonocardia dioxanivorans CB1190]AEA25384.1 ring-opening amidohydrolase [Pseudonocardia dioxanivorans CB1190]GJF02350.1 cyanuric acid amidohydrolase [Pseudonocardia sp. D17]
MTVVDIVKRTTSSPDDTALVKTLADAGYSTADVVALVAKTEGNGCVNDFSRTLADHTWDAVLPADAVTVFSGGTEGVLSPHASAFVGTDRPAAPEGALVAAVGRTASIPIADLGRAGQVRAVAARVRELCADAALEPGDVHLVLVKCPLLTTESISRCLADGVEPATRDTLRSMAMSRAASALGVAVALGEISEPDAAAALRGEADVWSSVASISSGAELDDCHILVLGNSPAAHGPLRAVHGVMRDAMDARTVLDLLDRVSADGGEVVQVLAKAEADPSGSIRGRRHTMLTDSDLSSTRHARAAVGGLLAGLVGDSAIYVSGGAEHQGPPGGGPVTVVYRVAS